MHGESGEDNVTGHEPAVEHEGHVALGPALQRGLYSLEGGNWSWAKLSLSFQPPGTQYPALMG